ncbi:MAG: YceD family protein [Gemmatimonadota bacterium]
MLSFDLRSLEANAARVFGDVTRDDPIWEPGDARPEHAVHLEGRISSAGTGKFFLSGHLSGTAGMSCRRCLEDARTTIDEEVQLIFVLADTGEADEPDVHVIEAREHVLDLRPAIREEWILRVPSFILCSEDCRGLCPACGANRNLGECICPIEVDSRWSALVELKDRMQ